METLELLFKIQSQGIDALDKAAGTVKNVSLETKYGADNLARFEKVLGLVTKSGESYKTALDQISKSGKELDKTTVQIAKDLLEQDKAFQKSTAAAEKAAKEQDEHFRNLAGSVKGAIQNPFNAAGDAVEGLLTRLGPTGTIAIGAAVGLGIAAKAAYDLSAATGALAEEHLNLSERTGLSVQEVGTFSGAAQLAGVNIGAIVAAMRTFSQALSDNSEEGKKGKAALRELNVEALDMNGHLRPMGELWLDIADSISKVESPTERARLAMALFGRGGLELMPLLRGNFRELTKEVEALGIAFTEEGAKRAAAYDDALGKLELRWQALKRAMGEKVIGVIEILWPGATGGDGQQKGTPSNFFYNPSTGKFEYRTQAEQKNLSQAGSALSSMLNPQPTEFERMMDLGRGGAMLSDLERSYGRSDSGRQGRIAELNKEIETLRGSLLARDGKGLASEVGPEISRLKKLEAERDSIQRSMESHKAYALVVREAQSYIEQSDLAQLSNIEKIIRKRDELIAKVRNSPQLAAEVASAGNSQIGTEVQKIIREARSALANTEKQIDDDRGRRMDFQAKQFGENLRKAIAGDSEAIRELERSLNEIERAQREADRERQQAEREHEREMLRLRKERTQMAREEARDLYQSLRNGRGLGGYFGGLAERTGETIFTNATAPAMERLGDQLSGAFGGSELLKGTIFGSRANTPVDKNTDATERNTKATERLEKTIRGANGGTGGIGGFSGDLMSDLLTFGSDVNGITGNGGKGGGAGAKKLSTLDTAVFAGAGLFGVYQGLRQGGGRGISSAISSGLGAAAMIPGPQQPFIAAGALIAGFVSNLFGDSREEREAEQRAMLEGNRYREPAGVSRFTDLYGGNIDYDSRGNARVTTSITVNIDAMDAKSFMDRKEEITDAVNSMVRKGHGLGDTVREIVIGV